MTVHRLKAALARPLARLLYPRGSVRSVRRGPFKGMRFVVGPAMGMTYAWQFEAAVFRRCQQFVTPGSVVYDIGANVGAYTLAFARMVGPGGAVMAFEPMPLAFDFLQRNVALNGMTHVRTIAAAVSDAEGMVTFAQSAASVTQGRIKGAEPAYRSDGFEEVEVASHSIDALVEGGMPPPSFLKLDVEGGGERVLRGAAAVLERYAPAIYFELHGETEQRAARDHLQARGYRLESMDGRAVEDPVAQWTSPLVCYRK